MPRPPAPDGFVSDLYLEATLFIDGAVVHSFLRPGQDRRRGGGQRLEKDRLV